MSLELGGNAPLIVFDDADVELAAKGVVGSAFRNAGQTCICANRIFVQVLMVLRAGSWVRLWFGISEGVVGSAFRVVAQRSASAPTASSCRCCHSLHWLAAVSFAHIQSSLWRLKRR